jgi:hypothetical protein
VVACAYIVPSGPVTSPDAVMTRRPALITCPVATTLGVFTVSALTRFHETHSTVSAFDIGTEPHATESLSRRG